MLFNRDMSSVTVEEGDKLVGHVPVLTMKQELDVDLEVLREFINCDAVSDMKKQFAASKFRQFVYRQVPPVGHRD